MKSGILCYTGSVPGVYSYRLRLHRHGTKLSKGRRIVLVRMRVRTIQNDRQTVNRERDNRGNVEEFVQVD